MSSDLSEAEIAENKNLLQAKAKSKLGMSKQGSPRESKMTSLNVSMRVPSQG